MLTAVPFCSVSGNWDSWLVQCRWEVAYLDECPGWADAISKEPADELLHVQ